MNEAIAGPASRSFRLRAVLFRLIRMVLLVYLGLMLVLSGFQAKLIFPGQASQGLAVYAVVPRDGLERVEMTAEGGERVVGLFGAALEADGSPREDADRRPTILFFYGNGDSLAGNLQQLESFRRLGANVMIAEYLGYGLSGGQASEQGCYATADAALAHLRSRTDIDPSRIIAAGWSLGGAVAVDLASREELAGLAVFCSFTSMQDMVRRFYPIPGLGLFLKHRFENLKKIEGIRCPTLIGHGSDDQMIPVEMSDQLAWAAGGPVMSFRVPTDHNDFFLAGGDRIQAELSRLVEHVASTGR
ncbi:alpha/beta hydrolase [Tautonia rosea]|uniref:alpha/beta hydrolase n=1 Tax=Tautonia rosea TaxID=2728037 RepID=UPI0014756BFF|nr:alpha/beta hydrolase [Tautonia rosea]